jgi:hypothetical protein
MRSALRLRAWGGSGIMQCSFLGQRVFYIDDRHRKPDRTSGSQIKPSALPGEGLLLSRNARHFALIEKQIAQLTVIVAWKLRFVWSLVATGSTR